jgi:hypothetical protein
VNLIALLTRRLTTCRRRAASPRTASVIQKAASRRRSGWRDRAARAHSQPAVIASSVKTTKSSRYLRT